MFFSSAAVQGSTVPVTDRPDENCNVMLLPACVVCRGASILVKCVLTEWNNYVCEQIPPFKYNIERQLKLKTLVTWLR